MKRALVIGCNGQDGTYLYNDLVEKSYSVLGIGRNCVRCHATPVIEPVDILKPSAVLRLIEQYRPDEVYYLAAVHHSSQERREDDDILFKRSFNVHVHGLIHVLDALKQFAPDAHLFYAASSHIFGTPAVPIQNESTPLVPECIYGITKTAGLEVCRYYRRQFGLCISVGILYNHESPLRPDKFVSQKIVRSAIAIKRGRQQQLVLGDLNAGIDWGFAGDYVEAMQRILQLPSGDDFIIASGTTHTVQEFVEGVFQKLDLDWTRYVHEDKTLIQKSRRHLQGDYSKLQKATGWTPKTDLAKLIDIMVKAGLKHDRV